MDEPNSEQPEVAVAEEAAPAEETPNPLFAEEPEGDDEPSAFDPPDEAIEEETVEAVEGEEKPEKADLSPGLKKRMAQLARQKRDARRAADDARAEAKEAKARAESASAYEAAVKKVYDGFKDPLRVLEEDARIMAILEANKNTPEVQAVLRLVKQKGGLVSQEPQKEAPAAPAAAAIPEPVAALLRQTATDRVDATLAKVGVKEGFRAILRDAVLAAGGDSAASMDEATILGHAKSYITKYGLSEDQVVEKSAKKAAARPPTGGSSRPAVNNGATQKKAAAPAGDEKPKSMREWEDRQAARRAAFLQG